MRFTLAIMAALANAAGPWLCCCALAAATVPPTPAKKSAPKCSHCVEAETPVPKSPAVPAPAKPCPCKERHAATPTAVQPATETSVAADAIAHDFSAPAGVAEVVSLAIPSRLARPGWPFLTTEARLHVHHVLRC